MNFNPFNDDKEDTSFEKGMPINQAAKTAVNATNNAAKAVNDQAQLQVDDTTQAIIDQLYGPSTPGEQEQGTDEANPSHVDQSNSASRAVSRASGSTNTTAKSKTNSNQTPDEEAKIEKIRHELFSNYSSQFNTAHNGPFNITTNLEQEMEKARKEREQKEMDRKREEEEEEQRKKEEEERQKQEVIAPAGKKAGAMFGKKQQQPMAVNLERTKTETGRRASG